MSTYVYICKILIKVYYLIILEGNSIEIIEIIDIGTDIQDNVVKYMKYIVACQTIHAFNVLMSSPLCHAQM